MLPTREDIAWCAGLYEGEGSISIKKRGGLPQSVRLSIQSTDRDVLVVFQERMQMGYLTAVRARRPGELGKKPISAWSCGRFEDVQLAVALFWPWLGTRRREQVTAALRTMRTVPVRGSAEWRRKHTEAMRRVGAERRSTSHEALMALATR